MPRTLLLLALIVLLTGAAAAYDPRPYLEPNLSVNFPVGDFAGTDLIAKEGGAKTGFGAGFNLGLADDFADFYFGYHVSGHDAEASSVIEDSFYPYDSDTVSASGTWTVRQWQFGTRVHARRSKTRISPAIGMAVTSNQVTADASGSAYDSSMYANERSAPELSIMIEGGLLVHLSPFADLAVMLQNHDFDAYFDHPLFSGRLNITYMVLQTSVVYRF